MRTVEGPVFTMHELAIIRDIAQDEIVQLRNWDDQDTAEAASDSLAVLSRVLEKIDATFAEPGTPTCDLCGEPWEDGGEGEDWNGDTGNHRSCEKQEGIAPPLTIAGTIDLETGKMESWVEEHNQDCIDAFHTDGGQSGCICGKDGP